ARARSRSRSSSSLSRRKAAQGRARAQCRRPADVQRDGGRSRGGTTTLPRLHERRRRLAEAKQRARQLGRRAAREARTPLTPRTPDEQLNLDFGLTPDGMAEPKRTGKTDSRSARAAVQS